MQRMKLISFVAALVLSAGLAITSARAATVTIVNLDGAGEGFNDPTPAAPVGGNPGLTIGQQRLNAFTYAANIWGACLQSAVPILVNAQMNPLACNAGSAVLGSAGAVSAFRDFVGAPLPLTWYPSALANALAGVDLDPGNPDINAQFNSNLGQAGCLTGTFFYYGLDHNPPGGTIDFVSVVLHEIGHGLGFQTFVNQAGARLLGFNDHYMVYLEQHGAAFPWMYPAMSDAQRAAAHISDPNLHWAGPIVTGRGAITLSAGMSGGHVRMHGPNPYVPGSSVSHWSTALTPNEIMEPAYTGANHEPGMAWALMDEIGWTLCARETDGCSGAVVNLAPSTPPTNVASDDGQNRGVFVTALKDFNLCSIGIEGDFVPGETLNAYVYAANGTTRGALLASGSTTIQYDGNRTHYVDVSYLLQECKEYDLVVQWVNNDTWPWWNENLTTRPYDIGGVIRVRDGESAGLAGNFALGHFSIQGSSPNAENLSSVSVSGDCDNSFGPEHGAFVTAKKTVTLHKLGVRVGFAFAPSWVRAYVYQSAGNVRGALVAEGVAAVPSTAGQVIGVPVQAVLKEGQQYDIGFQFGTTTNRYCHVEAMPWQFGDLLSIDGVELAGTPYPALTQAVPAFEITWSEGSGGELLDLVGPWHNGIPSDPNLTQDNTDYGMYVTATKNSEVFSLGWYADVPAGQVIGANVYAATGTTRGAIITSGTVVSRAGGKRWHDIPVSATLALGQNYDLEIDIGQVDSWDCWKDLGDGTGPALPYNAYGILTVVAGESMGDASNYCLIDMRIGSCTATVTGVPGGPVATPKFMLKEAFPNPFSGTATLGFELDQAATVSVQVFDVAGRKVADVVKSRAMPAGPGQVTIDAKNLASGVYFVKLSTPSKSVTRKITIVR